LSLSEVGVRQRQCQRTLALPYFAMQVFAFAFKRGCSAVDFAMQRAKMYINTSSSRSAVRYSATAARTLRLAVHEIQEVLISLRPVKLAKQELHALYGAQRVEHLAEYPHLVERVLVHEQFLFPRT